MPLRENVSRISAKYETNVAENRCAPSPRKQGKTLKIPARKAEDEIQTIRSSDVENMILLTDLSPFTILHNLKNRYLKAKIYTYIGNIVISVNPYKDLLIDGPEIMMTYLNHPISTVPPHLYGLAEMMYQSAVHGEQNQVVIISGESGSGKTEAFKRITRYLAAASEPSSSTLSSVARRVLDSTPLLESFGNATTLRNDNSSRFGKYVEIYFANSIIIGAKITNFLLEKCRVVGQGEKERNYHVFYELLSSLDNASKKAHHLENIDDYRYLIQGPKLTHTTHSDPDGLAILLDAWRTLGLPPEEIDLCLRVISAVLHLGNLNFKESHDGEKCTVSNPKVAEIAASELGVKPEELVRVITMKLTETVRESLWSPVRRRQAVVNRDSIAKQIYSEFFDRLVSLLNDRLSPPDLAEMDSNTTVRSIALLDIYGFENLPCNSLEQLCINYANENLQRFFNFYIFELEQDEYQREGIDWQYISFPDNEPIIKLISDKPHGLFHICNDEASMASGTDSSFLRKCVQYHTNHANFEVSRVGQDDSFVIVHFAGRINYNIKDFVAKNREQMRAEVLSLLSQSQQPIVADMFRNVHSRRTNNSNTGPRLKTPMVLSTFNNSLLTLMEKMEKNKPQFVRCIKPNMEKKPMLFEDEIVLDQLRYTGVLEATRIRKSGFPVRPEYREFIEKYGFLLPKSQHRQLRYMKSPLDATKYILERISTGVSKSGMLAKGVDYELGITRLFMRSQLAVSLDTIRSIIQHRAARLIQRAWRRRDGGLYERALHNAAKTIQSFYRGYRARQQHPDLVHYLGSRIVDTEPEDDLRPLTDLEISRLEIPSDLAYILEERRFDQPTWLSQNRVTKPKGSIRRLLQSNHANGWQTYGRPVWDAQPLTHHIKSGRPKINIGYQLAPRSRPILLMQVTETQRAACLAASKLILRLVHMPEQPIMEQFLIGSYLYQLALTHKELHREILTQMLVQTLDWPWDLQSLQDSDKEDEDSLFRTPEYLSRKRTESYAIAGGTLQQVIRDEGLIDTIGLKRRAYRRLWMHIAGMLTCGRLSEFLKPIFVRFLRQHAPHRSAPICEDRLALAPSMPRLYPPCLLEWRGNYTGSNMGVSLTFPDGLVSLIHVGSFTRSDALAGVAMALRIRCARALVGWTVSFHTPEYVLDVPGYCYVMDVFASSELPPEWSNLSGILPDHVFLMYSLKEQRDTVQQNHVVPHLHTATLSPTNGTPVVNHTANFKKVVHQSFLDPVRLADKVHGIDKPVPNTKEFNHVEVSSRSISRGTWNRAVHKMATKRFPNVSRSQTQLRRMSSKRERQWRSLADDAFPRPQSPADLLANARFTHTGGDSPIAQELNSSRKTPSAIPYEMRYYAYEKPEWTIRIRKEHISPKERIRSAIILNVIFAQIVADVINPSTLRLTPQDKKKVLSLLDGHKELDSLEYLTQIPLTIKKDVLRAALEFPVYFGRFFPVLYDSIPASNTQSQWLVVGHHGVRLACHQSSKHEVNVHLTVKLGDIKDLNTSRVPPIPGWRLGDTRISDSVHLTGYSRVPMKRGVLNNNMLILTDAEREYRFYSDLADRIADFIQDFMKEYDEEMERLKEAAEKRALSSLLSNSDLGCETPNRQVTPDPAVRYVCSPPLLTTSFPTRETPTPLPGDASPVRKESIRRKAASQPPEKRAVSKLKTESEVAKPTEKRPPLPIKHKNLTKTTNGLNGVATPTPIHSNGTSKSTLEKQIVITSEVENHPLLGFAKNNFSDQSHLAKRLRWQSDSDSFTPLLNHADSDDHRAAQNAFSLILRFSGECKTQVGSHVLFKQLVELLWERPMLSDEVYCQLVKQTYGNQSKNADSLPSMWLLWSLVSIFVPTTDALRPYLQNYVKLVGDSSNSTIQTARETLSRSMDLVSKYGKRKVLPPTNILKALASGVMFHRQQVNLPNSSGLLATVGQLSLVRDVIRGLVEQLDPNPEKYICDFVLFVSSKNGKGTTSSKHPMIPLQLDEYLLDFPVYDEENSLFFRRLWWTVGKNFSEVTQPMLSFLFDQVATQYIQGHWITGEMIESGSIFMKECVNLSALLHYGSGGSAPIQRDQALNLRPRTLKVSDNKWIDALVNRVADKPSTSLLIAQTVFLESLSFWPLFSAMCFLAELELSSAELTDGELATSDTGLLERHTMWVVLSRTGVQILKYHDRITLHTTRYEELASIKVNYHTTGDKQTAGTVTLTSTKGRPCVLHLPQAKMFIFVLNRYQQLVSAELLASE